MMAARTVATAQVRCTSTSPQSAKPAPRLTLPKHLALVAAGLGLGAPAAQAVGYGPGASTAAATIAAAPAASASDFAAPPVSLPSVDVPDVSGLFDGLDPLIAGGAVAALALGGLAVALNGGSASGGKVKGVSAAKALEALAADEYVVLLDIRSKADVKEAGSPNLKGVSRRGVVSVPFTSVVKGEEAVDEAFGSKVARVRGVEQGGAPVILLDSSGSQAAAAAKAILQEVQLDKLYYVQGGADAWKASGQPWKEPGSSFSLALPSLGGVDLSGTSKTIASSVSKLASNADSAPATAKGLLAALGVVGASALLFSQVEVLLELAGLLAAGQFLLRVVFADEREKTLTEIKKVVSKIEPDELPEDLSKIASTLLDDPTTSTTVKKTAGQAAAAAKEPALKPKPVPVVAASNGASKESSSGAAPAAEA